MRILKCIFVMILVTKCHVQLMRRGSEARAGHRFLNRSSIPFPVLSNFIHREATTTATAEVQGDQKAQVKEEVKEGVKEEAWSASGRAWDYSGGSDVVVVGVVLHCLSSFWLAVWLLLTTKVQFAFVMLLIVCLCGVVCTRIT